MVVALYPVTVLVVSSAVTDGAPGVTGLVVKFSVVAGLAGLMPSALTRTRTVRFPEPMVGTVEE